MLHDESMDALPKFECDDAKIRMKGDKTPMSVLLVVDSSTGHLGATDVDQKGDGSGLMQNGWRSTMPAKMITDTDRK